MSEWREVTLDDVAEELTVGYVGPMASEYVSEGIPFLRSQNIEPFRLNLNDVKFVGPLFHENLRKSALSPGDVVIVRTGKPGACAVIPESLPISNCSDIVIVRCGPELDARFLMYYVNSVAAHHIHSNLVGAVQQHFNVGAARRLRLRLPLIQEQRTIAHILGTLDDKIEVNRCMNETLEAMARAIFKSWFVDFVPVRAKASGEPNESICRRLGLTPELLALFPDNFQDSELGEIPVGWEVMPLEQLTSYLNRGISPKYIEDGGVLVLNQKCVRNRSVDPSKGRRHDPGQRAVDGRLLEIGDILVNSTGVGTLGRVAQLIEIYEPAIVDSHITIVRADTKKISWNYLGVAMLERQEEIEALGEGSTGQTELSRTRLGALSILRPPLPLRNYFDHCVIEMRKKAESNNVQSSSLASTRDALLPKLLSGDFNASVEGAA